MTLALVLGGCSFLHEHVLSDPRENQPVTGWRIAANEPGASCAATCNAQFEGCKGGDTVDTDRAVSCNQGAIDCYSECPGVTTGTSVSAPVTASNARAACAKDLQAPDGYYCFAYWPGGDNFVGLTIRP